jgi:hypothetical protein
MAKTIVDELAESIKQHFRTFGDRQQSDWNPIVNATAGEPLQFAAGVDVAEVIVHILHYLQQDQQQNRRGGAVKCEMILEGKS